jgi:hypothetical protein
MISTNGGQISEVKSFSMDTHEKTEGLYNIETTKVLTYTSQNGSHLMGEESYLLDIAGNWSYNRDDIVCVFARANGEVIPAFCNKVTASSKLTSVTTAQIESVGGLTAVARTARVPAALKYEISVTPDANSASGYAEGIVSTMFTVSVMEGRSDGDILVDTPVGLVGLWTWGSSLGDRFWMYGGPTADYLYFQRGGNPADDAIGLDVAGSWVPSGPFPPGPVPGGFETYGYTIVAEPDGQTYTLTVAAGNVLGITPGVYTINPLNQNADGVLHLAQPIVPGQTGYNPYLTEYDELTSTLTHIDTATVAGGITTFTKEFNYQSGITCTNC